MPFSDVLETWLSGDDPKTVGALGHVFAEKSFAVAIMLLMFLPATPLPTGGITHVFELIAVILAGQMVIGRRTIWLPARWRDRPLGAVTTGKAMPFIVRWVRRVEKYSRPRGAWLFRRRLTLQLIGVVLIGLIAAAAVAPPFSGLDTLPALGAVGIALAIILDDVLVLAIGTVIGAAGVVLIVTVGATLLHAIESLFYTSMREPMMTVRSRGRPKYSAASAVIRDGGEEQVLAPAAHPWRVAAVAASIVDRKYDASSTSIGDSSWPASIERSTSGTFGLVHVAEARA